MKQTLILILSIFVFTSCSKEGGSEPETETETEAKSTCLIKIIERIENGSSIEKQFNTYNDKGIVIRIDYGTQSSSFYQTFNYQSDKIVMFDKVNHDSETLIFNLDASSRIISDMDHILKYDTDGYLIESIFYGAESDTTTTTYIYTNGNLTKLDYIYTNLEGLKKYSRVYEYSSDAYQSIGGYESGLAGSAFDGYSSITEFYGKTSKNLISKETFSAEGRTSFIKNYTYKKDDQGRTISMKSYNDYEDTEWKVTYECI